MSQNFIEPSDILTIVLNEENISVHRRQDIPQCTMFRINCYYIAPLWCSQISWLTIHHISQSTAF